MGPHWSTSSSSAGIAQRGPAGHSEKRTMPDTTILPTFAGLVLAAPLALLAALALRDRWRGPK
jgi:hypothetical protein